MTVITYKWTVDRYHQAVEAGIFNAQPLELLNGELIEMSPEGISHAALSSDAGDYFRELLGLRAKIREGKPITLPNNSEPEPDIAVLDPDSAIYRLHHPYPENIFWIIEYSNSSLQKDLDIKSKVYAAANISEYWVINLKKMELVVFRDPVAQEYRSQATFTDGVVRPLAFQDTAVSVSRLLT